MQNVKATIEKLKGMIELHKDFPQKGVLFRDIFPILRDPTTYRELLELLVHEVRHNHPDITVDAVVGLDSRGFLLAPAVAQSLHAGFVPVRKGGKLPGPTEKVEYKLEYGSGVFEIQTKALKRGQNVAIVDDLLATGGTMNAAWQLAEKLGCNVLGCFVVVELTELNGRSRVQVPVHSLIQF